MRSKKKAKRRLEGIQTACDVFQGAECSAVRGYLDLTAEEHLAELAGRQGRLAELAWHQGLVAGRPCRGLEADRLRLADRYLDRCS